MKKKKGHQRSRLRVDPFNLLQQLCEQDCTLSELQQRTGFDPAEMKPLRAARTVHLDPESPCRRAGCFAQLPVDYSN